MSDFYGGRHDAWKDSYDDWKLRSPYDEPEYDEEPDDDQDEPDWDDYDPVAFEELMDKVEQRQRWRDRWDALKAVICFWRRWRKPRTTIVDDDIPF